MWSAVGDMAGARKRLVSALVNCGATKYLALHLGDPAQPESRGRDLVLAARCTKNPEAAAALRRRRAQACARGDERAAIG